MTDISRISRVRRNRPAKRTRQRLVLKSLSLSLGQYTPSECEPSAKAYEIACGKVGFRLLGLVDTGAGLFAISRNEEYYVTLRPAAFATPVSEDPRLKKRGSVGTPLTIRLCHALSDPNHLRRCPALRYYRRLHSRRVGKSSRCRSPYNLVNNCCHPTSRQAFLRRSVPAPRPAYRGRRPRHQRQSRSRRWQTARCHADRGPRHFPHCPPAPGRCDPQTAKRVYTLMPRQ